MLLVSKRQQSGQRESKERDFVAERESVAVFWVGHMRKWLALLHHLINLAWITGISNPEMAYPKLKSLIVISMSPNDCGHNHVAYSEVAIRSLLGASKNLSYTQNYFIALHRLSQETCVSDLMKCNNSSRQCSLRRLYSDSHFYDLGMINAELEFRLSNVFKIPAEIA